MKKKKKKKKKKTLLFLWQLIGNNVNHVFFCSLDDTLGSEGMKILFDDLKGNTTITKLNLSCFFFILISFVSMIIKYHVMLTANHIDGTIVQPLCEALKVNTTITDVNLLCKTFLLCLIKPSIIIDHSQSIPSETVVEYRLGNY